MEKIKEKHVRFYIDMTESEDHRLAALSQRLTERLDIKMTRAKTVVYAVKHMAKKEGV